MSKSQIKRLAELIKQRITVPQLAQVYGYHYREDERNPCPICEQQSTSGKTLALFDEGTRWHCFHCDEGGDVISWLAFREDVYPGEAIQSLANRLGLELDGSADSWAKRIQWARNNRVHRKELRRSTQVDIPKLTRVAEGCHEYLLDHPEDRPDLGIPWETLKEFGWGWHRWAECWTAPMYDDRGRVVGVRTRHPDGHKASVKDGTNGLFLPFSFLEEVPEEVWICEGATDAPAVHSLGLPCIGRASCNTGGPYLLPMVRGRVVTVVADRGDAGVKGAFKLGRLLTHSAASVRVMAPPPGAEDAREWVRQGADEVAFRTKAEHGKILKALRSREVLSGRMLKKLAQGG